MQTSAALETKDVPFITLQTLSEDRIAMGNTDNLNSNSYKVWISSKSETTGRITRKPEGILKHKIEADDPIKTLRTKNCVVEMMFSKFLKK